MTSFTANRSAILKISYALLDIQ